jgi:hypothetical protein
VNQLISYLHFHASTAQSPPASAASTGLPAAANTGVVGPIKDVSFSAADAQDKVTVTFPAGNASPGDFSDLLIGETRVDPSQLVKVGDGYSFQINKDAYANGSDLRAISKSGASAQQVMGLFK